jgi:hypothetical protein
MSDTNNNSLPPNTPEPNPLVPVNPPSATGWGKILQWAFVVILLSVLSYLGIKPASIPPIEESGQAGWVRDDEAVKEVKGQLPFPTFGQTPAGRSIQEAPDADAYLWKAAVKVTGDLLPGRNQLQVGSCVSFGTATAIEHTILFEIATWVDARGPPPAFKDLAQEVIYGGSRVQIGGGKIRGDGSVGAWAAKFVHDFGFVARGTYGKWDLTKYTESQCRQLGQSGCPADLLPIAAKTKVGTTTQIQSADEAAKAIQQGYGIAVCSNQGFARQRDKEGFCRPQGQWAHCMAILGVQFGERKGFFIANSWGDDYFTGPMGKGDGPRCGFWADWSVVDRMIRNGGDTWAFSDADGFPARQINWRVMNDLIPAAERKHFALKQRRLEVFNLFRDMEIR